MTSRVTPDAMPGGRNGQADGRRLCALLIEDDADYATCARALLDAAELDVLRVGDVAAAVEVLQSTHVHLVLFGARAGRAATGAQRLHETASASLIVLADDLGEAREAYANGADQVLPRPFVPGHLAGAVQAALRARDPDSILQMASSIRVGEVLFDAERREVRWDDGFRVRFSAREWELLAVLLSHANRFFNAEDLRDAAWGDASLGTDQVRGYVYRLRRKLEGRPLPCRLVTSRGLGYCLRLEAAPQPTVRA
jgi:DNA-binding response OmpR family regulator